MVRGMWLRESAGPGYLRDGKASVISKIVLREFQAVERFSSVGWVYQMIDIR